MCVCVCVKVKLDIMPSAYHLLFPPSYSVNTLLDVGRGTRVRRILILIG